MLNVGSGGGAAAAPSGGATGGAPADAPVEEEKKEEKEEGKPHYINIEVMCANNCISHREGGIGRGYGLWAFRLDTLYSWFTSYCNQNVAEKNIPSLQERRPGGPLSPVQVHSGTQ